MKRQYPKSWLIVLAAAALGALAGCSAQPKDDVSLSSIKASSTHQPGAIGRLGDPSPMDSQGPSGGK
ncbi:MAG: hypothetical protein JWQ02_387 [Capsulimonas sp.]|jgi:hypothetical protein|nr:hypothetical protein [Capsulimonas sp.]